MAHVLLSAAVGVAVAALALVGKAVGTQSPVVPASPFGSSVPVHLAQVGHIEVDLEGSGPAAGLVRVRCAGSSNTETACFVSR